MTTKSHRAIVLTDFWAGILGTLLTACIIGGLGYAWNANAQQAITQEKVEKLENANLPSRLDKLEENVKDTKFAVDEVKIEQRQQRGAIGEVNRKLDLLVGEMNAKRRQ